jgi:PIN domain nuclease of toxin-antitoxin system
MTVLLDTHALLFWFFDDPRLSASARAVLADPTVTVLVSSVSAYEVCIKHRLGKLSVAEPLVGDIPGWIAKAGFRELPVSVAHAARAGSWPQPHRDPFDRILAAQATSENVPLVSRDEALRAFGINLLW